MRFSKYLVLALMVTASAMAFGEGLTVGTTYAGTGGVFASAGNNALAQGFLMPNAGLINGFTVYIGPSDNTNYTLWLTDKVGAGTTADDVIFSQTFNNPSNLGGQVANVDVNQTVDAGQYYIVLSVNSGSAAWYFGNLVVGTIGDTDQMAVGSGYNASFAPASSFYGYSYPLTFSLFDDPVCTENNCDLGPIGDGKVPEPSSMLLLGSGVVALWRRKRA